MYLLNSSFKPSSNGWKFANDFQFSIPILKPFHSGFCGGMCWLALKIFHEKRNIPDISSTPIEGEDLFNELFRMQIKSVIKIVHKVYFWQISSYNKLDRKTLLEVKLLKNYLEKEEPVTLCLIKTNKFFGNITRNHQVIAYAMRQEEKSDNNTEIFIYDPNYPCRDDICINIVKTEKGLFIKDMNKGERITGFFINHFSVNSI
ncbi:MAG: hypothetical protein JXA60_08810 [Candidatus Coatesbacteria bacterium]|nr:hypothetical protein [Candidatus Coatesbacteria bacterium]